MTVSETDILLADAVIALTKAVLAPSTAISRVARPDDNPVFEDLKRVTTAADEALDMIRRISVK